MSHIYVYFIAILARIGLALIVSIIPCIVIYFLKKTKYVRFFPSIIFLGLFIWEVFLLRDAEDSLGIGEFIRDVLFVSFLINLTLGFHVRKIFKNKLTANMK